ncbi:MAG: endonuclease/exonuclease/phosphatase family protein [Clostridiales bacterium]|nr:endonuclease/exonuclease/phosphatase family protein [Clostridiales bacterium]
MQKQNKVLFLLFTFLFSFHFIRVFIATMMWKVSFAVGNPVYLAIIALVVFLGSFLLIPLSKRLKPKKILIGASIVIIAVRLVVQFVDNPLLLFITSSIGMLATTVVIPIIVNRKIMDEKDGLPLILYGFPLAVFVDIFIKVLLKGYDLSWIHSYVSNGLVIVVSICSLYLLKQIVSNNSELDVVQESTVSKNILFIFFGMYFYLYMVVLQNANVFIEFGKLTDVDGYLLLTVINAVGLIVCIKIRYFSRLWLKVLAGFTFTFFTYRFLFVDPSKLASIILVCLSSWFVVGYILDEISTSLKTRSSLIMSTLFQFLGFVIMIVLTFLNYEMLLIQSTVIGVATLSLLPIVSHSDKGTVVGYDGLSKKIYLVLAVCLVIVGANKLLPTPIYVSAESENLVVMTYNIHQGFDADYRMDLDAIIDEINASEADIIALQEVNRGQVMSGMVDNLKYISDRVYMKYYYGSTYEDQLLGNAFLTNLPVESIKNDIYTVNKEDRRGYLTINVNHNGKILTFVNTHLNYIVDEPENNRKSVRSDQVEELLLTYENKPYTVLMGDLNSIPDSEEIQMIYDTGYTDTLQLYGLYDTPTFWAGLDGDAERLDYIFTTSDIITLSSKIVQSRASDHKPVIAVVQVPK